LRTGRVLAQNRASDGVQCQNSATSGAKGRKAILPEALGFRLSYVGWATGMTREQCDELLRAACDFQGLGLEAREKCRENFRRIESEQDNVLRILVDGQVGRITNKLTRKVQAADPAVSYQISVVASFVHTHFLVSDLIITGDLVEAITLIRKQLESLTRLHELDSKPFLKLAGKVPNIKNFQAAAGRMYGDLSEVAHFSTARVSELLHVAERGELVGPSLLPVFTERSFACFDMAHFVTVYFIAWVTEKLPAWYPGYNNDEDQSLLAETFELAIQGGVLRLPQNDNP
jgi:hypothetical protein